MSDRERAALLAACIASPDDDAPRLVWADAIGGERGELVVIQCDLARGGLSPAETAARGRRQRELLATHGPAWSGLGGVATRCTFDRGFVDAAEIPLTAFLDHADPIRAAAPLLRALTATGLGATRDDTGDGVLHGPDALALLARLFAHPAYRELEGLAIRDASVTITVDSEHEPLTWIRHGPAILALISETRALSGLRAFAMSGNGAHIWGPLVETGALTHLERLWIGEYVRNEAMSQILGSVERLLDLEVDTYYERLELLIPVLPRTLRALRVSGIDDAKLAKLAASPIAGDLEWLWLDKGDIRRDGGLFASFSRLRGLVLTDIGIGLAGYSDTKHATLRRLVAQFPPSVRELRGVPLADEESVRIIVDALGPQLHLLDLDGYPAIAMADEIEPRVAGQLVVGPWYALDPLLHVGPSRSPSHPIVSLR